MFAKLNIGETEDHTRLLRLEKKQRWEFDQFGRIDGCTDGCFNSQS